MESHQNMLIVVRSRIPRIVNVDSRVPARTSSTGSRDQRSSLKNAPPWFLPNTTSTQISLEDMEGSTHPLTLFQSNGDISLHDYFPDTLCICVLPRKT
jgi:hypothetical protein